MGIIEVSTVALITSYLTYQKLCLKSKSLRSVYGRHHDLVGRYGIYV